MEFENTSTIKSDRPQKSYTIFLEGRSYLVVEKKKYISSKNNSCPEIKRSIFALEEISAEQLEKKRQEKIPSFVLKENEKYYYTQISNNIKFYSSNLLGEHLCGAFGKECSHLSAANDENGGCKKVRMRSRYIEKFPWIKLGYETFNTGINDVFVVCTCEHYESIYNKKNFRTHADLSNFSFL